jgi:hypothetical protein
MKAIRFFLQEESTHHVTFEQSPNVSGIVQIETGVKHDFSIAFQSVVTAQSVNVGTLVNCNRWKASKDA